MTTEQAPREPAAEALELASVLRCMTECGAAPDDLWTRDQPDGDPFVARAAELLEHFARALVASQAQPTASLAGMQEKFIAFEAGGGPQRGIKEIRDRDRLQWLHGHGSNNVDGYEWGIYRVKWVNGKAAEVWQTNSDFSDLDAAIGVAAAQQPAEPRQDSVHAGESSSPPTTKRGYLGSTVDGGIDDH